MKQLEYTVFPSDEKTIYVEDDPLYGGAHKYLIWCSVGFNPETGKPQYDNSFLEIPFIHKRKDGTMEDGVQSEQLAYVLLDRAEKENSRHPSPYNEKQIAGLQMFLEGCEERIRAGWTSGGLRYENM